MCFIFSSFQTDFLMSVFFIFPVVIDRLVDAWLAGEFMCRASSYISLGVCYGSTYMLVVLSADRLYAVVRPLSAVRRGVWYKWTLISVAWIIAFLLAIPAGLFAELYKLPGNSGKHFCHVNYPEDIVSFHNHDPTIHILDLVNNIFTFKIIKSEISMFVSTLFKYSFQFY